jgi:hypothetical protein
MAFREGDAGDLDYGGSVDMERYCTWDEAVAGHRDMVEKLTMLGSGLSREQLEAGKLAIEALLPKT